MEEQPKRYELSDDAAPFVESANWDLFTAKAAAELAIELQDEASVARTQADLESAQASADFADSLTQSNLQSEESGQPEY